LRNKEEFMNAQFLREGRLLRDPWQISATTGDDRCI